MRVSLRTLHKAVSRSGGTDFTCNRSMTGERKPNGVFVVYSYGSHFPIAAHVAGRWIMHDQKYSVTTSRHQSKVRQHIGNFHSVADVAALRKIIDTGVAP